MHLIAFDIRFYNLYEIESTPCRNLSWGFLCGGPFHTFLLFSSS
nr:MAG TPA: hypothetical protein [Caudoviricetes sp.]